MRTGTAQLCFCRCVATATIQTILLLLAILVVVAIVARRLNSAPSILLVVAGIALALTRDLPPIELAPNSSCSESAAADLFPRRCHYDFSEAAIDARWQGGYSEPVT